MHFGHRGESAQHNRYRAYYTQTKAAIEIGLVLLCVIPSIQGVTIVEGKFSSFAFVGRETTSNDEPTGIVVSGNNDLIVGGTTSPLLRGLESDLGKPLATGLKQEDFFLAKINSTGGVVEWVYRGGTSKEDRLQAMLLDKDGKHLYIGGRTFGQFSGTKRVGQSDIFIIKYDISGSKPEEVWLSPLILGSQASDAVTALAQDPENKSVIYATGFTSGDLFPGKKIGSSALSDAILFSFYAKNGSTIHKRQFGTYFADQGTDIVISDRADGPIFVSAITEREIGQYAFGNFHMYKLGRDLSPLGDLLLRTYSREQMSSFDQHPLLPSTLIALGSSWLDSRNGYDVFVKRIVRAFDSSEIGSKEADIDEVSDGEYTKRLRSEDGGHDYASGLIIDPESGRLIVSGYTAGAFAPGSQKTGILAPFIAAVDPMDASMTDAKQMKLESAKSWVEISCIAMATASRGVYFVAKESNVTSNQFHLAVGTFGFPALWKNPITIAPSPDPTPSPKTGAQGQTATKVSSSVPVIAIIVGSVCGGVMLALIVVAIVIGIRIHKRSKTAKVYDAKKVAKQPKCGATVQGRKGPVLGPQVDRSSFTGLV